MNRALARILSWMLHPAFLPTLLVLFILNLSPLSNYMMTQNARWILGSIVFVFTCFLPGITSLVLVKIRSVESLDMKTTEERKIPFLTSGIYYLTAYYLLRELHFPKIFTVAMLGASMAIMLASVVNLRWKISIHMTGIGCLSGILIGLNSMIKSDLSVYFMISVLLAGILGTARISLNAHSSGQIYVGFITGFFCEWILLSMI